MSIYHNPDDPFLQEIKEWFINNPISNEELKKDHIDIESEVPWNKGVTGYMTHSEEKRKQISESMKIAWQTRSRKHKNPRVFTEEWRQKLSEARKKNTGTKNPTYGKRWKWNKETKENLGSN